MPIPYAAVNSKEIVKQVVENASSLQSNYVHQEQMLLIL